MADTEGIEALQVQQSRHLEMDSLQEDPDVKNRPYNHNPPQLTCTESEPRRRPWSTEGIQAVLSPSPSFIESRKSKDDIHVASNPSTPKRPTYPSRGLSLQMPPRDVSSTSTANLVKRVPLSPKLDPSNSYAPAGSALPRRSRGLDFSRACTNLHHSTLAEQSSPDSSPIVGGRGGMMIPLRKAHNSSNISIIPDSPGSVPNSLWSTIANADKGVISTSLGSANVMEFESGTSSSDDASMGQDDEDIIIHTTPQIWRSGSFSGNGIGQSIFSSPGGDGLGAYSPAAAKLMSFQRARIKRRRSRKSSSSASGQSVMHSPGPASPPLLKSIESSMNGDGHWDPLKKEISSRRESLSLGTCDLQLSDGDQSDGAAKSRVSPDDDVSVPTPVTPSDGRRNVIRKAVTRRSNLLPKSKNFARIRAALQEENAPVDTEVKREAEVIRQARESDAYGDLIPPPSHPNTTASSPSLQPVMAGPIDGLEDIPEDMTMDSDLSASRRSSSSTFTQHAIKNSAGLGFWNNFDDRIRTPPPAGARENSSGISDDVPMDTPQSSVFSTNLQQNIAKNTSESRSSTPQIPATTSETMRKGNKRMREDDFDPHFFKRRAVSPGMSLQNSPILPQSPLQRDGGWSSVQPKYSRDAPGSQAASERISSGGSVSSGSAAQAIPSKRVGFQGMSDTNDGLMNMSIE